jgi:hypothetical protein
MADIIANAVFDAALGMVDNCTEAEVRNASSAVLVDGITLNAGNFGSPEDNSSGGGRRIQCLVSSASDMKAISVSSAGAAAKVALIYSGADYIVSELASAVSLGASDQVNLGAFYVILKDPT